MVNFGDFYLGLVVLPLLDFKELLNALLTIPLQTIRRKYFACHNGCSGCWSIIVSTSTSSRPVGHATIKLW